MGVPPFSRGEGLFALYRFPNLSFQFYRTNFIPTEGLGFEMDAGIALIG